MKTTVQLLFTLAVLFALLPATATGSEVSSCPVQSLEVERLPQLNVARNGHQVFFSNGTAIVMGGHTAGFIPTATAESYHDGQWNLQPMVYTHDQGLALQTRRGEIIICGGHLQPLGIGQTFTFERYDPATGTFDGYGCLEQKRCFAQALEMDSGKIVISGNWYDDDCIELFDGSRQCHFVKAVSQHRSMPYILRTAKDNAIIFSSVDIHGEPLDSIIVDRLQGESFSEPLLQQWKPINLIIGNHCADGFIGDEQQGRYAYIITAYNQEGQLALIKTEGEQFSLLPTSTPVPVRSQWGEIAYFTGVIANRPARQAYMVGYGLDDADHRLYVLRIDYDREPAALTLLQSEPQDSIGLYSPVLTPEGNLLMAGGTTFPCNNFSPHSTALLLHTGSQQTLTPAENSHFTDWMWLLAAVMAAVVGCLTFIYYRKKKKCETVTIRRRQETEEPGPYDAEQTEKAEEMLMQRICLLMEQEQLYLNSELKKTDVAKRLNTNSAYISSCINNRKGCSFSAFVNSYRIEYAKKLLLEQPETKVYEVCVASGFSTEASFFRVFKTLTGTTPSEWRQENGIN